MCAMLALPCAWDLLLQCDTEEALVQHMLEEYEVDEATLRTDVGEFLTQLRQLEIL